MWNRCSSNELLDICETKKETPLKMQIILWKVYGPNLYILI